MMESFLCARRERERERELATVAVLIKNPLGNYDEPAEFPKLPRKL